MQYGKMHLPSSQLLYEIVAKPTFTKDIRRNHTQAEMKTLYVSRDETEKMINGR